MSDISSAICRTIFSAKTPLKELPPCQSSSTKILGPSDVPCVCNANSIAAHFLCVKPMCCLPSLHSLRHVFLCGFFVVVSPLLRPTCSSILLKGCLIPILIVCGCLKVLYPYSRARRYRCHYSTMLDDNSTTIASLEFS